MYQIKRLSRVEFVPLRRLNYHVRLWGEARPEKTPLVLLHGWMDVAASYQFMVDALVQNYFIIAPDWRGFGLSAGGAADCFWFPDYLADLDALLEHYVGSASVDLVGHSMGGNVAMLYAGIRPQRVHRLVNLEGFGLPATRPDQAIERYAHWLDELQQHRQGAFALKNYASLQAVAERLMKTNARLGADKARWLAAHWAVEKRPGEWRILADAAHKISNPVLYRVAEVEAIYRNISAPVLMVEAADDSMEIWWKGKFSLEQHHQRIAVVPQLERVQLPDCGHMLHHDQPQLLAQLLEQFLASPDVRK